MALVLIYKEILFIKKARCVYVMGKRVNYKNGGGATW